MTGKSTSKNVKKPYKKQNLTVYQNYSFWPTQEILQVTAYITDEDKDY